MEKDTRVDLWKIVEKHRVMREEGQREDDLPPHRRIGLEGNDRYPHEIAGGRGWRKVD